MNVIVFSGRGGRARQFNLAHPLTVVRRGVLVLAILGTAFALGMQLGERARPLARQSRDQLAGRRSCTSRSARSPSSKRTCRSGWTPWRCAWASRRPRIRTRCAGQAPHRHGEDRSPRIQFRSRAPTGGPESEGDGRERADSRSLGMLDQLEQRVDLRDSQLVGARERDSRPQAERGRSIRKAARCRGVHLLVFR